MLFTAQRIPYQQTKAFAKIALDYIKQSDTLTPFFSHPPNIEGIAQAIQQKKQQPVNRQLLAKVLHQQYADVQTSDIVKRNIELLTSENTFTICTAHQPNIFTGHLYFIYKILHVIKIADDLKTHFPDYYFVPVFYMGSEDADLAELNHITVNGKNYIWQTDQTGAVGRMRVDKKLVSLIDELENQLAVEPYGNEIIDLLKRCFKLNDTVQNATFELVNALFGAYGLIVLIADDAGLKSSMTSIFEDDLFHQTPSAIVEKTSAQLQQLYHSQAHPRAINLFYLKDNIRERIIASGDDFTVHNTTIRFTKEEIKKELQQHPERFSPNVILRGLYQEYILPNIAFIGGGGELAYWLQLKELFQHYSVPFPVLVLRNSFLIIDKKQEQKIQRLGFTATDIFQPENELINQVVLQHSNHSLKLDGSLTGTEELFDALKEQAAVIDITLLPHVEALKAKAIHRLKELEKKMLRAEKRKYQTERAQIHKLKQTLFPNNGLQERVENVSGYYAKWGKTFIEAIYISSLTFEQEFVVLVEE